MHRKLLPEGKNIHVYKSGDSKFKGAKVNYNPLQFKKMETFLNEVAIKVPTWGAVRSIHTPNTGTIVQDLDDLRRDGRYVAAGPRGFVTIPGGYANIGKILKKSDILNHRTLRRRGNVANETKVIWIFRNGESSSPAVPLEVSNNEANWDAVLQRMTESVKLPSGPVGRLFHIQGKLMDSFRSLDNNGYYVAAGANEMLRTVPYEKKLLLSLPHEDSEADEARATKSVTGLSYSYRVGNPTTRDRSTNSKPTNRRKSTVDFFSNTDQDARNSKDSSSRRFTRSTSSNFGSKTTRTGIERGRRKGSYSDVTSRMSNRGRRRSKTSEKDDTLPTLPNLTNYLENASSTRGDLKEGDNEDAEPIYETLSRIDLDEIQKSEEDELEVDDDSGGPSLLNQDEDSIFRAKAKLHPSISMIVDYDNDEGGLFRAKTKSEFTKNTKAILEDSLTKIEIPVDMVEAKEVEEVY